jgi:heme-degrading monooxygenase HmoA
MNDFEPPLHAVEPDQQLHWPLPYYAVIFTSERRVPSRPQLDAPDYSSTATRMFELAKSQPGYLGVTSHHSQEADGSVRAVTISYWQATADIKAWRLNAEHAEARRLGRQRWYEGYNVRVARVEREYGGGEWEGLL